jgi:UDP-glucose 4-epimerase
MGLADWPMVFPSLGPALVTGGSGFVGRHIGRALVSRGVEVHALSRRMPPESVIPGARWWQVDLRDQVSVRAVVSRVRPSAVFHFAGCTSGRGRADPEAMAESFAVNLEGSLGLFESLLAATWPLKRVVCAGGLEEYGNGPVPFVETQREQPVSAYSAAQVAITHAAQMLHRQRGLPCVILRLGLVFGPEQSSAFLIPALVEACLAGRPFPMTSGSQSRDYVYIDDAVDAVIRAVGADAADGHVINVSEGVERRVADVARQVVEAAGAEGVLQLGALSARPHDVQRMLCSPSRARALLDWRATTSFNAGLRATVRWHSQHAAAAG